MTTYTLGGTINYITYEVDFDHNPTRFDRVGLTTEISLTIKDNPTATSFVFTISSDVGRAQTVTDHQSASSQGERITES